jgi:glutamate--cysteine ligase
MKGQLPAYPGQYPKLKDWQDHLTTLFPEVRLKSYLEMRGADSGPWDLICALPALWAGLLYDQGALDQASALIKEWSLKDIHNLRHMAAKTGLKGEIAGRPIKDWAMSMLEIASYGLKARSALSGGLVDEAGYLDPLFGIASSGLTPADRLLEAYHGPWQGDITRLYDEEAY